MRELPSFSPFSPEQASLESCYRAALYRVFPNTGASLDLRIGQSCAALETLFSGTPSDFSWAILTACNPASRLLPEEENASRQRQLGQRLSEWGYSTLPAENLADAGENKDWPPEPAFFVISLPLPRALELAADFGQNAFVCGGGEGENGKPDWRVPRLCWVARY
ncbi:MAG: DUF3293 domain-containing protein [Betaproteobacteria bacterium]|nr:DUF3293 domain-containing protein [Betaproteobacteria bacterium]